MVEAGLDAFSRLLKGRAFLERLANGRPIDSMIVPLVLRRGQTRLVGRIRLDEIEILHDLGVVARVPIIPDGQSVNLPIDETDDGVSAQEQCNRQ